MTNNGVGIAGVAWDAHVLPVKVLNYYGNGDDFVIGKGIVWAADHGADIINLSLGGAAESGGLCDSVEYATSKGALVVAIAVVVQNLDRQHVRVPGDPCDSDAVVRHRGGDARDECPVPDGRRVARIAGIRSRLGVEGGVVVLDEVVAR